MIECKDIPIDVSLVNQGLGIFIIPTMNYKSLFVEHLKILEFKQYDFSVGPVMKKINDGPISKAATQFC